jgi:glutamate decarboxylase
LHLGFEGYRAIGLDDMKNARMLSRALEKSGYYTVLSDVHRKLGTVMAKILDSDVEVGYLQYGLFFSG